ncbi:tripartite tricarboxylate transporter permease [Halalkalibacter akibai]|uniref:Tricarboxylate transport membrane protein TctA n=1 Tax=Halalkalibacter akibai (strain ATCC 43226 / DSM 21942 / CIP 109018 / JCM 9157 / 1139) TaxID=1236973 RepID=W4QSM8_HALA3|nr:tripartite tricarboxylate transporter permease [Halalkalibacter akibai]GAE34339.1 tricarboxylate transport membrane protein TctA [Halalkalibacter akibai JCM 9157]
MDFFLQVFEFHHLLVLGIGIFLGIIIGALPGLTPTMGVALMIPFTFSLGATDGLILLGGIYCGSVFGGSIPAILFNVPGAPANVATTFDGYPMTKQGKARKALELATIASVIGGLFGMLLLLFFAPIFADFSLRFGPTESFWISLFGITVIAAISDGSVSKNLMGGCFGIFLSFIGISTITGTARFTFGLDSLVGGLHMVAVLIGLFAFPQALRLIENLRNSEKSEKNTFKQEQSTIRQSFKDVLKNPKSVTIGSSLGAFVGMVPGAGGNIASLLAYNETKRFSKNKDQYGKGEKNGIIASESANNAMVGGSLIPLLTLGIPGSPTAAIFLGGLLIHGIWPGNNLFVDHAEVAYTFLYSMVVAQILLLFVGFAMIKYMTRLTHIPAHYMAPVIISFSIIGAYTTQNNVFDITTVVIIGLFMFILQKFDFSPAPIALGFILGTIAEQGLLHGLQVGAARGSAFSYFFTGSWNIVLYGLVLLTVGVAVYQRLRSTKRTSLLKQVKSVSGWNFLSFRALTWLALSMGIGVSIFLMTTMPLQQRLFPQITLLFLLILVLIEYVKVSMEKREVKKDKSISWPFIIIVGFVSIISLLINAIGFYNQVLILVISIPLFALFVYKQKLAIRQICFVGLAFTFILYIVFSVLLRVPLPAVF